MNTRTELAEMTAGIVAAYVENHQMKASELPALISSVHGALRQLVDGTEPIAERPAPAVPLKKSITPEYIICLEDGRKFKSLKRHLRTRYSMTPEEYRAKWGLPADYPMVAPNYARVRSSLAKSMGLGQAKKER
jgi:predicted transcriptional regulator